VKARIVVDPSQLRASDEIRGLVAAYADIDWFTPPAKPVDARGLFRDYHALAYEYAPDRFAPRVELEEIAGTEAEFAALCARVREESTGWDWQYGGLKLMSRAHTEAHGGIRADGVFVSDLPDPGALAFRMNGNLIWCVQLPQLDGATEAQAFYKSYADLDLIEAIQWQLAEPTCPLDRNPFVVLGRLWENGVYPFHHGQTSATLFTFA